MTALALHGYQRRAVKHLHENPRAGLFLEMGLGKTATVLSALTPDHLPALVIAPKRVAENVWEAERDRWRPDLSLVVAAGSATERKAAFARGADVTAVGRDNTKDVPLGVFRTVILDELSGYKSRASQRWRLTKKLTDTASYVWGLTGTPTPNGLLDLWPQMYLIDRGQRLGTSVVAFRERYFKPGRQLRTGVVTEWLLKPGADERIHELISDVCLSMSSADHLDLPPVTHNRVTVPLPAGARRAYEELKAELVTNLELLGGGVHTAANAAVLSSKLSQVTAGFVYSDDQDGLFTALHDAKVQAVAEIVEGTGSPVLVFYRFKAERDALLAGLPGARTMDDSGVLSAWSAGRVPVLLAHPASAGHGLNLQHGGHTMVWASLPWSLEEFQQACGRLARQGQEHPVVIHYLLCPGSVDEAILNRLEKKSSVQDALLAALA